MTLTRRLLAPPLVAATALLAIVVPGALGAQTTPTAASATAAPATAAVTTTSPTGATQTLSATVTSCHNDPLPANRYAIFASQMTSVTGTLTMAVNFQLQERKGTAVAFLPVSAPGFGAWVSSAPGVGIYTYDHEVTALPAPAAFRVSVRARWFDRHHHVIHREALLSPVCVQPLITPNLAIGTLTRAAGTQAATLTYSVVTVPGVAEHRRGPAAERRRDRPRGGCEAGRAVHRPALRRGHHAERVGGSRECRDRAGQPGAHEDLPLCQVGLAWHSAPVSRRFRPATLCRR
jgi:hypothetical protein